MHMSGRDVCKDVEDRQCIQPRSHSRTQHGVSLSCTCLAICKAGGLTSTDTHTEQTNIAREQRSVESQSQKSIFPASKLPRLELSVYEWKRWWVNANLPIEHVLYQRICCAPVHLHVGALLSKNLVKVEPVLQ